MQYAEIDWNLLWQEAQKKKAWRKKNRQDWDKKASGFAKRNADSPFTDRLLELFRPRPEWTVLDVGSGPGTLALPLARQVRRVTALDFSGAMLEELRRSAGRRKIDNIDTYLLSWTDDWNRAGIRTHDIAISSRSLSVLDLRAALEKLDEWATQKVFVVDRVGSGPFDPDVFEAVGRTFEPGPDYIYTINLLYQMGIYARVDFIDLDGQKRYSGQEEAVDSCRWMLGTLSGNEEKKLVAFVKERLTQDDDGSFVLYRNRSVKWAVISWDTVSIDSGTS